MSIHPLIEIFINRFYDPLFQYNQLEKKQL